MPKIYKEKTAKLFLSLSLPSRNVDRAKKKLLLEKLLSIFKLTFNMVALSNSCL